MAGRVVRPDPPSTFPASSGKVMPGMHGAAVQIVSHGEAASV